MTPDLLNIAAVIVAGVICVAVLFGHPDAGQLATASAGIVLCGTVINRRNVQ